MNETYAKDFSGIVEKAKAAGKPMRVAVAGADAENILRGLFDAQADGFAEPILIGNPDKIRAALERAGLSERSYDLHSVTGGANSVQYAIEMINAGQADTLMRGNTSTRDFLLPVLNKSNHLLRKDELLTHIVFLKVPSYPKLLAVSDVTVLIDPPADGRKEVVRNMVKALKVFGVEHPNIALLALVETPSFHMRDTVEDQTMARENLTRPIADCNLVGPIAYDLIISKEAARLKNYDCPYCGEFDGIVVPNLMSGNLLVKVLQHNVGATGCGLLVGATIPIAISSRSDAPEQAYLSLAACAAMLSDAAGRSILG
ncbi:MAG: phosphate acyltransferase [Oscillospiraceae bacterium]|nr:phosphate acyltransferase [Oscillospiraceae bacterium]